MSDFSNLRDGKDHIGTPMNNPKGAVYCDTCGSEAPGTTDIYHATEDRWERNVPCPAHNAYAHNL